MIEQCSEALCANPVLRLEDGGAQGSHWGPAACRPDGLLMAMPSYENTVALQYCLFIWLMWGVLATGAFCIQHTAKMCSIMLWSSLTGRSIL